MALSRAAGGVGTRSERATLAYAAKCLADYLTANGDPLSCEDSAVMDADWLRGMGQSLLACELDRYQQLALTCDREPGQRPN